MSSAPNPAERAGETLRAIEAALPGALDCPAPDGLHGRIMRAVDALPPPGVRVVSLGRRPWWAFAAAAAFLGFAAFGTEWHESYVETRREQSRVVTGLELPSLQVTPRGGGRLLDTGGAGREVQATAKNIASVLRAVEQMPGAFWKGPGPDNAGDDQPGKAAPSSVANNGSS
ncbi:hypothetical protein HZA57_04980 [Candidatus Poribacteria bacterium]|nr:hypothetical protein [Candidatus Poribacteria bacterium]